MSTEQRVVVASLLLACVPGCYGNAETSFPAGLEPWEAVNVAPLPEPVAGDPCPEQIRFIRTMFREPDTGRDTAAVHARACIHQPIREVWEAVRDPQTGRDPGVNGWRVLEYETETEYDWSYQTWVFVRNVIDIEFHISWRHGVVEGTEDAPIVTATRWKKTFGTTAISNLEGSIVLQQFAADPNITEVHYQYHLNAAASGHDTIEAYLGVIYARLRDRSHDRPLDPRTCEGCPTPPEGYPSSPPP